MFVTKRAYNEVLNELEISEDENYTLTCEVSKLREALLYIVSQQTKTPNATVNRIVSRAKEALK